jgi:DNA-binding MarR family transcriptional regulator
MIECDFRLMRPDWTVLICLRFRGGVVVRDICEITGQPGNTVSRGVALIKGKRLIRSRAASDDARRVRFYMTATGLRLHDRIMALSVEAERHMVDCLSEDGPHTLAEPLESCPFGRDVEGLHR